jgi:hypothetical protein
MRYVQCQRWSPMTTPWRVRLYQHPWATRPGLRRAVHWARSRWATHWQVSLFVVRWAVVFDVRS